MRECDDSEKERRQRIIDEYLREHGKKELDLDGYIELSDRFNREWLEKTRYVIKGKEGTVYEGHCYGPAGLNDPLTHDDLIFLFDDRDYAQSIIDTDLHGIKDKVEIIDVDAEEHQKHFYRSYVI